MYASFVHISFIYKSFSYHICTGDCDFCVKDDYHFTDLNPQMGTNLDYKFMCNYDFHVISYKGKIPIKYCPLAKGLIRHNISF